MPRHRLAALFEPRSVLVFSDRPLPILQDAPARLRASMTWVDVMPGQALALPPALAAVAADGRPDVALVCVPPDRLTDVFDLLRGCRPRGMVVLPHPEPSAHPLEDAAYCRTWAQLNDCLILGPRSFGLQRPHLGLNLSHDTRHALPGRVALVTQSRTIASAITDWAGEVRLGFSAVVCLGDESVVDAAHVLDFLAMDARTDSIALYLESPGPSRRFASALRAAASVKPVVVLKSGLGQGGDMTHEAVFNAMLRRTGAVRIAYFVQLFSALKVLVYARRPQGRRVAVLANGNAPAQLALDVMQPTSAVHCADLAQPTRKALQDALEPGAQAVNPVITAAPLTPQRVRRIVEALQDDPGVDGLLVLLAPDPLADLRSVAEQLAELSSGARKPIVTCFMGDAHMRELRHVLDAVGTPAFRTPESAADAFGLLATHHYNQQLAQQTLPPEPLHRPPRVAEARALVQAAQRRGLRELDADACWQLLSFFDVPVRAVPQDVARPEDCYDDVPPMAVQVRRDAQLGPYVHFGASGARAPGMSDRGIELPPLNGFLARQMVERSALWRHSLSRLMTPDAASELQEVLERISDLVCELPSVESIALDPLYADGGRLVAGAVSMTLSATSMLVLPETAGYRHMAIHPYPRHLVQERTLRDGTPWLLRPIRPEDAEPLQEFMRGLSDESRYMRFVSMLRELTPRMLARYTRIDYDRELALVATVQAPNPENRGHPRERIIGFAHYLRNADGRGAEYALVIGDDWQRGGLGAQLMRSLIEAAQEQRITYIEGFVLANNRPMLGLMTHLGFRNDFDQDDPGMRRVWLDLGETRRQY